jgi:hypothetical protein
MPPRFVVVGRGESYCLSMLRESRRWPVSLTATPQADLTP